MALFLFMHYPIKKLVTVVTWWSPLKYMKYIRNDQVTKGDKEIKDFKR